MLPYSENLTNCMASHSRGQQSLKKFKMQMQLLGYDSIWSGRWVRNINPYLIRFKLKILYSLRSVSTWFSINVILYAPIYQATHHSLLSMFRNRFRTQSLDGRNSTAAFSQMSVQSTTSCAVAGKGRYFFCAQFDTQRILATFSSFNPNFLYRNLTLSQRFGPRRTAVSKTLVALREAGSQEDRNMLLGKH